MSNKTPIKIKILRDYDEWADLGNAGWGWKDVLPFFIKSEKLHNDQNLDYETHIDHDMHGREGRQHVMPGCKVIVTKLVVIIGSVFDHSPLSGGQTSIFSPKHIEKYAAGNSIPFMISLC